MPPHTSDTPAVLVFDFDGVIVAHSEFYKEKAWEEVFKPYEGQYEPYYIEAARSFGFGKPGDRYDILRAVFTKLGVEDIEAHVAKGAVQFGTYVEERILKEGVVVGAEEVLRALSLHFPLYINSGTAEEALRSVTEELGISDYFKGILGGPKSKAENMRIIAAERGVSLTDLMLIGDTDGDVRAAHETGCHFIGVTNEWNGWYGTEKAFPLIAHIQELKSLLIKST